MKFLCLGCDEVMSFAERQLPGDGTLAAVFACPACEREIAMLANPMETRFVSSMGIQIGGRTVPEQPMELVRGQLAEGREDAFDDGFDGAADPFADDDGVAMSPPTRRRVEWSPEATTRLGNVPSFVRGMVKRIYTEYAAERGIPTITPEVMDRARSDLGLEGM